MDDEMPDPLIVGAAGKALAGAVGGTADEAAGLFRRVLGPAADELGVALARYTNFRLRNIGRITEKAERKSSGAGQVPPRVAHQLLEDGSYCDDELMVEYLSGVLAGSRTPEGRDDQGIVWSRLVTGMSAVQLRAHFLLYREWAAHLALRVDINLGIDAGREVTEMHVLLTEFIGRLSGELSSSTLTHAIPGLVRLGLLDANYGYGSRQEAAPGSPFNPVLRVRPSVAGIELYGWALGRAGMTPVDFVTSASDAFAEDDLKRLVNVKMPRLPAVLSDSIQ